MNPGMFIFVVLALALIVGFLAAIGTKLDEIRELLKRIADK